mmetsp:Transcript_15346/g.27286  ORF Transcript_15346/g.27286 Transcript_15346/m.27286 type:complete len:201 (-) Transcript_15346:516-1118(-)
MRKNSLKKNKKHHLLVVKQSPSLRVEHRLGVNTGKYRPVRVVFHDVFTPQAAVFECLALGMHGVKILSMLLLVGNGQPRDLVCFLGNERKILGRQLSNLGSGRPNPDLACFNLGSRGDDSAFTNHCIRGDRYTALNAGASANFGAVAYLNAFCNLRKRPNRYARSENGGLRSRSLDGSTIKHGTLGAQGYASAYLCVVPD